MSDNSQSQVQSTHLAQLFDSDFIKKLTQQMHKFALLQLNDPHMAEDVVQEALVGALKNVDSFQGGSALKTWVFAILKNKIADTLRQKQRQPEAAQLLSSTEEQENFSEVFDAKGHWNSVDKPKDWGEPEEVFKQDQFWEVFDVCLNRLPAKQGKVFMAREFIGPSSDEICTDNDMTVSNLHVLLHRARLRLQVCLQHSWFDGGASL